MADYNDEPGPGEARPNVAYLQDVPEKPSLPDQKLVFGSDAIMDLVQQSGIFLDSKRFVDLKLKIDPEEAEEQFRLLLSEAPNPTPKHLKDWVSKCFFLEANSEFKEWDPEDWTEEAPTFGVKNVALNHVLKEVHNMWKVLSKTTAGDIVKDPAISTLLPMPNGFLIPGKKIFQVRSL